MVSFPTPSGTSQTRILLLGGTQEGRLLAEALAQDRSVAAVYSLAGVTRTPILPDVSVRIGGFGGVDGLCEWLMTARIDAVIDATHPFAARMSGTVVRACATLHVPLLRLVRPGWVASAEDRWEIVPDLDSAAAALGSDPRRVLLTTGRKDLAPFCRTPHHHYVIRSIDMPDPDRLPPDATVILDRPPFTLQAELALLRAQRIDIVVTKNAGSDATFMKLEAARMLDIPVIMVARPILAAAPETQTVAGALAWLRHLSHDATLRSV